jgi:purine-cytosine permease-like protein
MNTFLLVVGALIGWFVLMPLCGALVLSFEANLKRKLERYDAELRAKRGSK